MLRNTLTLALRNMRRRWGDTLLILFGLSSGIAVFMLAAVYTGFTDSFDGFHPHSDRIHALVQVLPSGNKGDRHSAVLPAPLLPALAAENPHIEASVRLSRCPRMIVRGEAHRFYESDILLVDPGFLGFFRFALLRGDPRDALAQNAAIVLSEASAQKYFGGDDPTGKTLTLDNRVNVTITGVVENPPANSSIRYDFLLSMETARALYGWLGDWSGDHTAAFFRLAEGAPLASLTKSLPEFLTRHIEPTPEAPRSLYPLSLSRFRKTAEDLEMITFLRWNTPYSVAYFQIAMAAVLLLVACINFTNLTTARFMRRSREIGLRKVIGARRPQLIRQFLGESGLLTALSMPLAVLFYELLRPVYINYLGHEMNLALTSYPKLLLLLSAGIIILGLAVGSYPAIHLSSFHPVETLKGRHSTGRKRFSFRKVLVVSQFALAILMLVFTVVIRDQLGHLLGMDYGYRKDNVIAVPLPPEVRSRLTALQGDLRRQPEIAAVSSAGAVPINWSPENPVVPQGRDESDAWTMHTYGVDYDFIELMGITMARGRSFSRDHRDEAALVLNQTAVRQLNWDAPLGKTLKIGGRTGTVIGVARDFIFDNPHWPLGPSVLYLERADPRVLLVRTVSDPGSGFIESIENKWRAFAPEIPFQYDLMPRLFGDALSYVDQMWVIFGAIGFFSIMISCLGLVALASFTVQRKTREIGIRKVLGASAEGITGMLLARFLRLVVLANLIAWPVTYFLISQFLKFGWAFRTGIRLGHFIFAGGLTLGTAGLSVIYKTVKASLLDPARTLRCE